MSLLPYEATTDAHPAVAAARALADDLLAPQAATVDVSTVPRSHLDALGAAGLLGLHGRPPEGATAPSAAVVRRVSELLAAADLATWFVQAQHHSPVRALTAVMGFETLLADLVSGRRVAGVATSHVRRPACPLVASRVAGGWRFEGTAPWYTGWELNDVALVAARSARSEVVSALVTPVAGPTLRPSAELPVIALQAARTVSLRFEAMVVPDSDVVAVTDPDRWRRDDARTTVNVNPAVFGVTGSALALLTEVGERRGSAAAVRAAARIGERVQAIRARAYALLDTRDPDEAHEARLELRSLAHRQLVEATTALVVASSGAAMTPTSPAQRKAREALFLLVQGQTGESREAALMAWAERGPDLGGSSPSL